MKYPSECSKYNQEEPKSSGIWATLDLTNPIGINNTRHQTNSVINIQGRLYNLFNGTGKQGYTVIIYIDGTPYHSFNDITNGTGDFDIGFTVDPFLDVFTPHRLEVIVDNPIPPGDVDYISYYNISISTTSYFELYDPSVPKILGENLEFEGYLRYENGNEIPFETLNYYWYDGPDLVYSDNAFTNYEGEINDLYIPDWVGDDLSLKFNFSNTPYINYSQAFMLNTKLFTNISCIWDLPTTIRALSNLTISGQVISKTDPNLIIKERPIEIYYNGTFLIAVQTDLNGEFSYTHLLSAWNGSSLITLRLVNNLGKNLITTYHITIEAPPPPITPPTGVPPFLMFFSIFIPILAGVIGGLAFYGYRYYKKQDKLSKVVNIPLESKIINLKILKDTGRLEESLSYLFNAIFMDLINAKFGRTRSDNETIRDFAIISVKDLKLSPTTIYPFIQKVEEIIYAKPFQITDKEFYSSINLFSPIYFELTGYNFVLNF